MAKYLITGVSSGLGLALTQELYRRGHMIWGVARRAELLKEVEQKLGSSRFMCSVCDVGHQDEVKATILAMEGIGFLPDVVILNAGVNPEPSKTSFALDEFEEVMRVNLFGALVWIEAFLPVFRARGVGQFAAISSLAAYRGDARWVGYSASKAALSRSFESFRGRHTRDGVAYTTIHLGAVASGMGLGGPALFKMSEAQAVARILSAIEHRATSVTIPKISRLLLELARILPDHLFSSLIAKAFAQPADEKPRSGMTAPGRAGPKL